LWSSLDVIGFDNIYEKEQVLDVIRDIIFGGGINSFWRAINSSIEFEVVKNLPFA
jgi:hypothetical protein